VNRTTDAELFNIACSGAFVVEDGTYPNVEQTAPHLHFRDNERHQPLEVRDVLVVCSIEPAKPDHD
jgi:hypothetical protein